MSPFFFSRTPKSAEEVQREGIARAGKELKEHLINLTPVERAKFWQDIESKGDAENELTRRTALGLHSEGHLGRWPPLRVERL